MTFRSLSFSLFLVIVVVFGASVSGEEGKWKGKTVVVSLTDNDLEDGRRMREFGRILDRADDEKANAVVFDIDVGEPAPWSSQQRLLDNLAAVKVPTFAFVNSTATGSGALITLASDGVYLAPSGIVGGAGLEEQSNDEDEDASENAQHLSILKARARSLARNHGHRTEIAEAFVDGSAMVEIEGVVISREGEVLTLTAEEATRQFGGRSLFALGIVDSVETLIEKENLSGDTIELTPREFGESSNRERLSQTNEKGSEEETDENEGGSDSLFGRRDEGSFEGKIVVLKVGEDTLATGKASFEFMDRALKKAELDGAEAVIFDMDTPGGFAWYTEGLVLNSLQNVSYPTYTFVNSRAESAGAIVAMGTDHIYMRPAATIGSALVVSGTGQDLSESMNDKVTQMIIGTVRNIAEIKGHNPDIAEAFVTRDKEVKVDGEVIHEAGNVLNLNTIRATEEVGGKPLLAKGVARSVEEIIETEGLVGEIYKAKPLGMEAFAHWTQKLSILLIMIGLGGAYLEMNSPGFGLPGLVSVLAFSLFFFGNYLAGNLAGYELAVLLVLGLILIGVEVFIFPGALIPGVVGAVLVLSALGLAMVDRVDFEWKWSGLPSAGTWGSLLKSAFATAVLGLVGGLVLVLLGMRYFPETRLGSRLVLKEAIASGSALKATEQTSNKNYIGLEGESQTDLVPSGKGSFGGEYLDIVTNGEFIGKGEPVRITKHEGSRIVVERVDPA